MHNRLTIVTRNALGDRISSRGACCQRMNASCSMSSASSTVPSIRYAIEKSRLRCSLNVVIALGAAASGVFPSSVSSAVMLLSCLERMTLFKVVVRDRQQTEEHERIDDVYQAEIACVAAAEVGNRGRHQRDAEAGVRELLHLERNGWDHERKDAENLGDRQFNLEVRRESKMDERALGAVRKWKMVVEDEVDDAEQHHRQYQSRARAVQRTFPARQCAACSHN